MSFSLGGSKSSSKSKFEKSSKLTSKITDTSSQTQTTSQYRKSESAKVIDAGTEANLRTAQSSAIGQMDYFTADQAKADSRIAVDEAVRSVMENYLPELNTAVAGSGMYGSTTQRQMQENLAGRAGAAAALTGLESIKQYGTLAQQAAQTLTGLAGQMGYKTIEEEETEGKSTVDSKATKVGTEVFSESGTGKATQSGYQAGASFGGK